MMLFHNLYILDDERTRSQLEEMLLERLKDEQVEVRADIISEKEYYSDLDIFVC